MAVAAPEACMRGGVTVFLVVTVAHTSASYGKGQSGIVNRRRRMKLVCDDAKLLKEIAISVKSSFVSEKMASYKTLGNGRCHLLLSRGTIGMCGMHIARLSDSDHTS